MKMKIGGDSFTRIEIGEALRAAREELGLDVTTVKRRGGPSLKTIRRIEEGRPEIRENRVHSYAVALNRPFHDIMVGNVREDEKSFSVERYFDTLLTDQVSTTPFTSLLDPSALSQLSKISGETRELAARNEANRALAFRRKGDSRQSLICNRIASAIYASLENHIEHIRSVLRELANLRPIGTPHELRTTIGKLFHLLKITPNVPLCLLAQLENEIGTVCFDDAAFDLSNTLCSRSQVDFQKYSDEHGNALDSHEIRVQEHLNRRRRSHLTAISKLDEGIEMLKDTASKANDQNMWEGEGNALFSILVAYIQHGIFVSAHEFLGENRLRMLRGSTWTQISLQALEGFLLSRLGDKKEAVMVSEHAFRQMRVHEFFPPKLTTPDGDSPFRVDIVLGLDSAIVREYGRIEERRETPYDLKELMPLLESF